MNKFWTFVTMKPSLALVLFSAILTGFSVTPSFASLVMHLINLVFLFGMWYMAKQQNLTPPAVLLLLSVGLTSVMTRPNMYGAILEVVNFFILVGAWSTAGIEESNDKTPSAQS